MNRNPWGDDIRFHYDGREIGAIDMKTANKDLILGYFDLMVMLKDFEAGVSC